MLWDLFLIKKLLKSVICGIYEQCTGVLFTVNLSTITGWTKKKAENVDAQRRCTIQTALVIKKRSGNFLIFPKRSIETSSILAKNCKKTEFIVVIGIIQSYLTNEKRDWILATVFPKFQEKIPCVRRERKLNFDNEITEILVLLVMPRLSMKCPKCMLGGVPEMEANCGNDIAKNEKKKKKNLWQLSCKK